MDMKKTILSIGLAAAIGASGNAGAEEFADILNTANNSHLVNIADRQAQLSIQIAKGYLENEKNGTGSKLAFSMKILKEGQIKLKNSISDPELKNLLIYLDMCMGRLERRITRQFTPANAETVEELSKTIEEGSRYVKNSLKASVNEEIRRIALLGM